MRIEIKKNLAKKEIINNIKSIIGLSSKDIQKITTSIIDIITDILIEQKKVNIKNFGSFYITHKRKREGRNPKNKENHTISARNTIKFKVSNLFKKKINLL